MASNSPITLDEAKQQFTALINAITKSKKSEFVEFVFEELMTVGDIRQCSEDGSDISECGKSDGLLDDPVAMLNAIANDIKQRVPVNAILPSENVAPPTSGENSDCLADLTVHVDDFLYSEEDVDELVEDGKMQRNYCKDCGSKNTEPLIFISHSMCKSAIYYIFNNRLPVLDNKTVLDIGSRLGAVLYGAHLFTDSPRIIGVEMNEDLCKLQTEVVNKYKMQDRIEILHKRIEDSEDVLRAADVIIINNAFEFYVSEAKHVEIWQFLREHIKSGTILITRPHLETTFQNLKTGIVLEEWVKPYHYDEYNKDGEDGDLGRSMIDSMHCDLGFYEIL